MANEFLVKKWKEWYKLLDVNHDGKISFDDVEESRTKFTELHHLEADKKQLVIDNFEKWWNDFIFRGKKGDVTVEDFVKMLNDDYTSDKAKFNAQMKSCINIIFDVIDTNKDRSISQEEFKIAFDAYGQEKIAKDPQFFKVYNPSDEGLVPLQDIVDSWVDFVTSDDPSKSNAVSQMAKNF